MASIPRTTYHGTHTSSTANASGNSQLVGIVSSVPMPRTSAPTMNNGAPVIYDPNGGRLDVGGSNAGYTVQPTVVPGSIADATGGGGISFGGGTTGTPPAGAQPPLPGASAAAPTGVAGPAAAASGAASVTIGGDTPAAGAAAPTAAPDRSGVVMTVSSNAGTHHVQAPAAGVAANAGNGAPAATAVSVSGFGAGDRKSTMVAKLGNGSTFSFPSFNSTKKSNAAPDITWGSSWTRVNKGNGFFYMQDADGNKAVPAVEWRITPSPLSAAKTVKMAHGWGKKLPDGTVIVFDKTQGAYYLDPKGGKHKLTAGTHTFGGVKVRIFEASVVRVLEKNGAVSVFDSRGNHGAGTPRSVHPDAGPSSAAGGGKMVNGGGAPVKAGGASNDPAAMKAQIEKITEVARGLLAEVQSGKVDPAALASLQSQLSELPDGIRQAIGGAGVMTGDAASLGLVAGGGPAALAAANGAPVAGTTTADATAKLAAGASVQVDGAGAQAGTKRFAQLPEELQQSIATAFKSELGTAAFEPDTQFVISASGDVKLAASATVYKTHQAHITGGGPGDDLAMTMKPVRQSRFIGADDDANAHDHATVSLEGTPSSAPGSTVAGGGAAVDSATRKSIFHAGERATIPALAGATAGTFSWAALAPDVRQAILSYIASSTSSAAGSAWASRQGDGWEFDPNATVVLGGGGEVTFPNGIAITRPASAAAPAGGAHDSMPGMNMPSGGNMDNMPMPPAIQPPSGAAPTDTPVGHDADIPPAPPGL